MATLCDFFDVIGDETSCTENFSGVGKQLFLFKGSDLAEKPTYDDASAGFSPDSFTFKEGKGAYKVDLKRQTGKVDYTSTPDGGGFTNTFTGTVASNMDKFSHLSRALNNLGDWGAMVSDGADGYYVIYDPNFVTTFNSEGTTGDTPDSDHGHNLTIACGPMRYPLAKWKGALTVLSEQA